MSIYAIGDIHGCYSTLKRLLDHIAFDPQKDTLWFVGDLVARGTQSLEVLCFIKELGDSAQCVLGNHDVTLLRIIEGFAPAPSNGTLDAIINYSDRDELIDWLRHRPLMILDPTRQLAIVHAGLLPYWSLTTAKKQAEKTEIKLCSNDLSEYRDFIRDIHSRIPDHWSKSMDERTQCYATLNVLTRIRYCDSTGTMRLEYSEPPGKQPAGLKPWFEWEHQRDTSYTLIIGHWASLGFFKMPGLVGVDTGCVWKEWGGELTAYRLDRGREKRFSIASESFAARP